MSNSRSTVGIISCLLVHVSVVVMRINTLCIDLGLYRDF